MRLRIKFEKHGLLRFIGHLDVMRYFQKCIRRAQIDVAYSGGFSPHQIMSFAAPLGVGLESNGEYMDIEVRSLSSCGDVRDRLNAAGVPGLRVLSVKILPEDAGNAMASVAAASYTVRFREGREPKTDPETLVKIFREKDSLPVTKQSKKGSREVDLKPGVYELDWREHAFHMLVDASSGGNIRPTQLVEALLELAGEVLQENALLITREETLTQIESDGERKLAPLDAVGVDYIDELKETGKNIEP